MRVAGIAAALANASEKSRRVNKCPIVVYTLSSMTLARTSSSISRQM